MFPEAWDVIGPMFDRVMSGGDATWSNDQLLVLERRGYVEEAYFTWSYSPIADESGGVGGVFTDDLIDTWIAYKRIHEVDALRLRPHPYEFTLYYDN